MTPLEKITKQLKDKYPSSLVEARVFYDPYTFDARLYVLVDEREVWVELDKKAMSENEIIEIVNKLLDEKIKK
jgi:hypothetical protein